MANPRMIKGAPSLNPLGRAVTKAKRAPGSDGVASYGGIVQSGETRRELVGSQKWVTYRNAHFHPAVAVALQLRFALAQAINWQLTPNPAGGPLAERGLEVVQQGLLDARLARPWGSVAPKALMYWANGFSLHALALGRRRDGLVVYTDIAHRPPHTVDKWFRPSSQEPWDAVEQAISNGERFRIPLSECLYVCNDSTSDDPTGDGALRLVVERLRRIDAYEKREGTEVFSSLGGTPIIRVPYEDIDRIVSSLPEDLQAAERARIMSAVEAFARDRIKTPEKLAYLLLDSGVYKGADPNVISSIYKWGVEILKGEMQGLVEVRKIITDLDLDVARMLGVEWVYMGQGSTGSLAMHADKTSMFAATLQGNINHVARCADQQVIRRLVAANGLDPNVAAPTLAPSRVTGRDVEAAARAIGLINTAGLAPNHPAKIAMFEALELPWQDEDDIIHQAMLPRVPVDPRASDDDDETAGDMSEVDDETDEEITDAD